MANAGFIVVPQSSSDQQDEDQATENTNTLPADSHTMKGGDGPLSYAKNSSFQRVVVDATKKMIDEVIVDKLDIEVIASSDVFRIADLGCSVGPNTFIAVQNIIESVENKLHNHRPRNSDAADHLVFQIYFNDYATNDFNLLFRSLPPSRRYFAAGVPGSFYGRLFSTKAIHFMHSSSCLNWLSRVPPEVGDRHSPAWNKGRIYCTGIKEEVTQAYAAQYKKDMKIFLDARARELVGGGLLVLSFGGVPDGVPLCQVPIGKFNTVLESSLLDMAKKGLVSEEKLDSFNLPLYYPSIKELEAMINENGHFIIEKLEAIVRPLAHILQDLGKWASHTRAGFEGLIKNHFGDEIVEEFFEYYTKKLVESRFMFQEDDDGNILLLVVLKRKY